MENIIFPKPLKTGAKVAIISPATVVKEEYIDGAAAFLRGQGYLPVIMPHAKGPADGSYASSFENRLSDFTDAWTDPEISAVLCARGGYGAAHLLPYLSPEMLRENAKWLVGFSDISALHAGLLSAGVASIHGPMAKHLTEEPTHPSTVALMNLLKGSKMQYNASFHPLNHIGKASGILMGGNLAVLNGLAAGPYDLLAEAGESGAILFIEDISEAIYAVERMLWRLHLAGTLGNLKGLIIGQFTEYRADKNFPTMEAMISSLLERISFPASIPVAFGFPVGHVTDNYPLIEGAPVALTVTPTATTLSAL